MKHIPISCFCLLLCILLSACGQSAFDGSRVKNETEFTLTFRSFNGSEFHTFDLDKGDGIWVEIDCEEGELSVTIQKEGDAPSTAARSLFPMDSRWRYRRAAPTRSPSQGNTPKAEQLSLLL